MNALENQAVFLVCGFGACFIRESLENSGERMQHSTEQPLSCSSKFWDYVSYYVFNVYTHKFYECFSRMFTIFLMVSE